MIQALRDRIHALLAEKERVLVAIDGSCAAGKTTLAGALAREFDCNVFHMDDFFLRPEQRTPERLGEMGGNVDYKRFWAEVLLPLRSGGAFSYRPYDCKSCRLADPVTVEPRKLAITEGSYSLHPSFGDVYDLKIFLTVDPELRRQRILQRPAHLHDRFFREWIPMEQRYFEGFSIAAKSDFILDSPVL